MPVIVSLDQIAQLAKPYKIDPVYQQAFTTGQSVLDQFGISNSPLRVAYFMAQITHETQGLSRLQENLHYSAQALRDKFAKYFPPGGPNDPATCANNPQLIANIIYARAKEGNTAPGDGYRYRGRGLLQLTFKNNYQEVTRILRKTDQQAPDFTVDPDAVMSPDWCLKVAAAKYAAYGCNELADQDNCDAVSIKINGGTIGLPERKAMTDRAKQIWH
jgi:putative chitinase